MINFLKKLKKKKFNRGISYAELIVVLSIFATLAAVSIYNFGAFQGKVDAKNIANNIALKVAQAQKDASYGKLPPNGTPAIEWKPSYGVSFNITSGTGDNKSFYYFRDMNQNGLYDPSTCGGSEECVEKFNVTKGSTISAITCSTASGSVPVNRFDMSFTRPSSKAKIIREGNPGAAPCSMVQMTVTSPKGDTALINFYPSGRFEVI